MNKKIQQEGQVRGNALKNDLKYLKGREGEKGMKKIERALQKKGVDFSFQNIRSMEWYPVSWQVEFLLQAKEILGWTDEDIFDLGYNAPRFSLLFRMFIKYFASINLALKNSHKYWHKHYTIGDLDYERPDPNKKEVFFYVKNFTVHPVLCLDIAGVLKFFVELLSDVKAVKIKEEHCPFADKYDRHQFNIKWN